MRWSVPSFKVSLHTLLASGLVVASACSADAPTPPKGIRAEPVALDFGFVPAGASVTKAIVIVNEGDNEVQITGVKLDGDVRDLRDPLVLLLHT